jgi:hypothetical protein
MFQPFLRKKQKSGIAAALDLFRFRLLDDLGYNA